MTISDVAQAHGITPDTLRYYERVGMIPPVTRTSGGIRDYTDEDVKWVELAICMRSAGLPVEVMIEYVKLFRQGDTTIGARLSLLTEQRERLLAQRKQIEDTLDRLNYKIARYEIAAETGHLTWDGHCEVKREDPSRKP